MVFLSERGKDIFKSNMLLKGKRDEENVDHVSYEESDIPNIVGQTNSNVENGYDSEPCLAEDEKYNIKKSCDTSKDIQKISKNSKEDMLAIDENVYGCDQCSYVAKRKWHLNRHIDVVHRNHY